MMPPLSIAPFDSAWMRVASCVVAICFLGCRAADEPAEARTVTPSGEVRLALNSPKRASLAVESVRTQTERVIATLTALVVPDEEHTVRVATPVTGRVITLDAQAGDHVVSGQPLAHIRSSDAAQATSDVAKALTAWRTAHATLVRVTDLFEHKVVSAREVEQARNDEATLHAEYDRARARVAQLGMRESAVSDEYVLRAPVAGTVIERLANPGAEVRADNGQSLFTISRLDAVWLSVNVPQRDLAYVHRGARLRFTTDAVPGRVFDARVNFVSDALDPASRTATARAVLANPGGALRVQSTGSAQLLVAEATPTVVVPTRALVTHGSDTVVFVEVAPGRYVRRTVAVRDDDGTTATISAGLAVGERIVTSGSLFLAAEADHTS